MNRRLGGQHRSVDCMTGAQRLDLLLSFESHAAARHIIQEDLMVTRSLKPRPVKFRNVIVWMKLIFQV